MERSKNFLSHNYSSIVFGLFQQFKVKTFSYVEI